jgi:hypothetical protein
MLPEKRAEKLTNACIKAMRAMAHDRIPAGKIAKYFNVSRPAVFYWLRTPGLRASHQPPVPRNVKETQRRRNFVQKLVFARKPSGELKHPSAASIAMALKKLYKITASKTTVLRDLRIDNVSRIRPCHCILPKDHPARLSFAKKWLRVRSTTRFLFSDEKIFTTNDCGHRNQWIPKKPKGMRPDARLRSRWPTGRVQVWGIIGIGFRKLVIFPEKRDARGDNDEAAFRLTKEAYKRMCLQGPVIDHLIGTGDFLMQDGASCHTAQATMAYLRTKNANVITNWPARSPDINPIENLWSLMARRVSDEGPRTRASLITAIKKVWKELPESMIQKYVLSFRHRLRVLAKTNGAVYKKQ